MAFLQLKMAETKNKDHQSGRYSVFLAKTIKEVESALRLRFEVFKIVFANQKAQIEEEKLESDEFDKNCQHLIVKENSSGKTVGIYRLNTIETAKI
jgi:putative hemolysin